jgi:hypothetical protein
MKASRAVVVIAVLLAAASVGATNLADKYTPGEPSGSNPPGARSDWRWPLAVLYDNGPLVTNPGGGAGGNDASALQTALGMNSYGLGQALSSGYRIADDFTVPAGGWQIDTITLFAYQTGSGTTSTINHVNLQIWNGRPGDAGATVVWGDTATNRLGSSIWSNIYRVTDTTLTNTDRPVMSDVVNVGTALPAGTYWLDFQTGGTGASGPWAPPITILGQVTTGNAIQWDPSTSTWNPANDGGTLTQQGFPFVIEGSVPVELQTFTAN